MHNLSWVVPGSFSLRGRGGDDAAYFLQGRQTTGFSSGLCGSTSCGRDFTVLGGEVLFAALCAAKVALPNLFSHQACCVDGQIRVHSY